VLTAVAVGVAILLVGFDVLAGRHHYSDIDDVLRSAQIHQLLAHGRWFDLTIAGIDMPGAYLSPWSRLVDLPYVLLSWAFGTVTDQANAVWWAFRIWQPVLLVGFSLLWVLTAIRITGHERKVEPIPIIAAFAMMPLTLWEFTPGRIDHHNVQIVLLMAALYGLSGWSVVDGFMAGVACGLSFVVGLELAPVLLIVLIGPGLAWIAGVPGSARVQTSLAAGLALTTLLSGGLLIGPARLMQTECDAFSAPFATVFLGYSALTALSVSLVRSKRPAIRFAVLSLSAVVLAASTALLFPACLQGPYHAIDPVVRGLWLDRIQQEKSFLEFYRMGETIKIVSLGIFVVVMTAAIPELRRRFVQGDAVFLVVFAVALMLLLLTFLQTRFIRFPAAVVLLFLPLVWAEVKEGVKGTVKVLRLGAAATLALGLVPLSIVTAAPPRPTLLDYLNVCTDVDASPLERLPPGRLVTPSSLALFLLDRLPAGMTVNAISFHRAAPGMRHMFDVFLSTEPEIRMAAAAPFDYLAVCRFPMEDDIPKDTVFATLTQGGAWPGLVPFSDSADSPLRVFRIDHARFR
jgi:uncharacterized membrane protein